MKKQLLTLLLLSLLFCTVNAKDYEVLSPNQKLRITVTVGEQIYITVVNNGYKLLDKSPVGLMIDRKMTAIPMVWDEIRVIDAKFGE